MIRFLPIRLRAVLAGARIIAGRPHEVWTPRDVRTLIRLDRIAAGRKPFAIAPDESRDWLKIHGNVRPDRLTPSHA